MLRHTIYRGMRVMQFCFRTRRVLSALVMLSIGSVAAADDKILLNDTWADGDRTNTSLPNDSATWIGATAANGTTTVTTGALTFNPIYSNSMKVWEYFTSDGSAPDGNQPHNSVAHLSVGDVLTATVTFKAITPTSASTSRNFRIGLFTDPTDARVQSNSNSDGGGTTAPWTDSLGYSMIFAINSNSVSNFQLGKRTASNASLLGSTGAYTLSSGGTSFSIADDTSYSAQISLKVVSSTQLDVTGSILQGDTVLSTSTKSDLGTTFGGASNVGSIIVGDQTPSTGIYRNFDQLFFRNADASQMAGLTFTNWRVTLSNNPPPITLGDANRDGVVDPNDIRDLLIALTDLNAYKTTHNVANDADLKGLLDLDGNGSITNADIQPLLGMFAGTGSIAPVPEPSSCVLVVLGCCGVAMLRRRA